MQRLVLDIYRLDLVQCVHDVSHDLHWLMSALSIWRHPTLQGQLSKAYLP